MKRKIYPKHLSSIQEAQEFIKSFLINDNNKLKQSAIRHIPENLINDIFNLGSSLGLNSTNKMEHLLWIYKHYTSYPKQCLECNKDIIDFESFNQEYKSNFCSTKCLNNNKTIIEKKKQTCQNKFGSDFYFQTTEFKDKAKLTYLQNYGVDHNMKSKKGFEKNMSSQLRLKPFFLPSGIKINLMGFEHFVLKWLLKNQFNESDFDFNYIPAIPYKNCIYHPDFYVKSKNLIIEVKSWYTYKKDLKRNLLKKYACLNKGFNFKFYIWDNGELTIL
jgi:hypothetical protein